MLFSSTLFLFAFLPIALAAYFIAPGLRARNAVLLFFSLIFYAWGETAYVFLLAGSIGLNFALGRLISQRRSGQNEKKFLISAVALNLLLLGVFKYADFFVANLNAVLSFFEISPIHLDPIHLPIGISFFTFQAITYIVDIHRGDAEAQTNPWRVGLYIALFPQLIAGPIVRYQQIAQELNHRKSRLEDVAEGFRIFIIGLSKKVLIADTLAIAADAIFEIPIGELQTPVAWLGIIAFTFQIYFDFSGYSDMAIGLGRSFGFHFPKNFNWPYTSESLREFWRRWHITLSSFFRDYLYIPMGGNRGQSTRTAFNLLTVFFLCGLWHGASWTFVLWGLLHGTFLALERTRFGHWLDAAPSIIRRAYVLAVVILAWTFFRSPNIIHGWSYTVVLFGWTQPTGDAFPLALYVDRHFWTVLFIAALSTSHIPNQIWGHLRSKSGKLSLALEWTRSVALLLALILCALSMANGTHNPFIYFRF